MKKLMIALSGISLLLIIVALAPSLQSSTPVQWKVSEDWVSEDAGPLNGHWSLKADPRHSLLVSEHHNASLWDKASQNQLDQIARDLAAGSETVNTLVGIQNWKYTASHLKETPQWKVLTLTANYVDIKGRPFIAREKYLISQKTMAVMTLTFPAEDDRWKRQSPLDDFAPGTEVH